MADAKRFSTKAGAIYDGSIKISPDQLQQYIKRQEKAIANNVKSSLTMPEELKGLALQANKDLTPELEDAKNLYHSFTGIPRQEEIDAAMNNK